MSLTRFPKREQGVMLLEALIGILIFTIGILGLIGLQAVSIKTISDAKYRADASFLANQIIGRMWADNPGNLASYAHRPTTGAGDCNFTGSNSANANVTAWQQSADAEDHKTTLLGMLPGTSLSTHQIVVGADNSVSVTLCWRAPNATAFSRLTTGTQINGTAP